MQKQLSYFLLAMIFLTDCNTPATKSTEQTAVSETQNSYINGDVPDSSHFDFFLKRDLEKHFNGIVKVDFLRKGPTQSGVSYPKYYLWVKVYQVDKLIKEGAVRVEAIDKKRFEVTDFVSIEEIRNKSKDIYVIFPTLVCEKIKSRL